MTDQPPTELVGALPADHLVTTSTELALALGGDITSFTGELLRLIGKADPENRHRLRIAYPRAVRSWEHGHEAQTQLVNPSSVYALHPVGEATARAAAARWRPEPVHRWELPALNAAPQQREDPDDELAKLVDVDPDDGPF